MLDECPQIPSGDLIKEHLARVLDKGQKITEIIPHCPQEWIQDHRATPSEKTSKPRIIFKCHGRKPGGIH